MEAMPGLKDLAQKYSEIFELIRYRPDNKRARAVYRFLLIKECEDFLKKECKRLGKKFRKKRATEEFCHLNGLHCASYYRNIKLFKKGGIEALVSTRAPRRSPLAETYLPIIKQLIKPGKGYKPTFDSLVAVCEQRGIKTPNYSTFWRIALSYGLSDILIKKKVKRKRLAKSKAVEKGGPINEDQKAFRDDIPEWIRVLNKRAFNIAAYKYSLVLPLLNPHLNLEEKNRLIDEILKTRHQPLPGITIRMSRASLLRCIEVVNKHGIDGLLSEHFFNTAQISDNTIWTPLRIDMNDPLGCLQQLKEIIQYAPATSPTLKKVSVRFLDHCLRLVNPRANTYNPIYLHRPLTEEELRKLEHFRTCGRKKCMDRATGILMANDNHTMLDISMATGCDRGTVFRWLKRFKEEGTDFIETKLDPSKNNPELRERKNRIVKILHHSPKQYGINRTAWVLKDIARVYEKEYGKELCITLISKAIKDAKYSWKSAKRTLTSPDPKYREKTKKVLDTLRNLGPNDAFFFIDEGGPYQVKEYGGKSFTPKGTVKTFPQFQKPKGRVTFVGSLDALKNQVTCFFTKSKNTRAVVCLIKILFYKYHECTNLYLTWDCASWHRSKGVQKLLDKLNADSKGPTVTVVPLPKQSQFLNVIESVFSGMKAAVIFNSDYQSEYEMKVAISRHFQERNEYFKANPKRAGKKIWDKEYYNLDEFESGLFKRM